MKTKKILISETFQVAPQFCPYCFTVLDAATSMWHKDKPDVGDFTICVSCNGVLCWGERMMLLPAKIEDAPPEIRLKIHKIREAITQRRASVGPPKGKMEGRA